MHPCKIFLLWSLRTEGAWMGFGPILKIRHYLSYRLQRNRTSNHYRGIGQDNSCPAIEPDGFTNAYYKKCISTLAFPLCSYFNSITVSNPLPPEALLTHVTVLPTLGKDPQHCASYWPISLLNSDTKLLAKILALRLQDCIVKIVHLDQTRRDSTTLLQPLFIL